MVINSFDEIVTNKSEVGLISEPLVVVLWNYGSENVEEYDKFEDSLTEFCTYTKNPLKLELDINNQESPSFKPSIEEPPNLELKPLLSIFDMPS